MFAISFLIASLALTSISHSQGFMKGAVAIWLFDEDGGKDIDDYTRNKHDGTMVGKVERVPGKFNMALEFGGAEEEHWVDIERPVVVNSVDFTIGCWINPGTPQHHFANVLTGRPGDVSDEGITLGQAENAVNIYRIVIGGVFNLIGPGNPRNATRVQNDEWSHLVFVREGRGGTWYVNGEPDRKKRGEFFVDLGSAAPVKPSEENFRIGNSIFNEERRWRGILDEVFIFERAMKQTEIQKIMNEGIEEAQNVESKDKAATVWGKIKSLR